MRAARSGALLLLVALTGAAAYLTLADGSVAADTDVRTPSDVGRAASLQATLVERDARREVTAPDTEGDEPGRWRWEGTVRDRRGVPVAGATVRVIGAVDGRALVQDACADGAGVFACDLESWRRALVSAHSPLSVVVRASADAERYAEGPVVEQTLHAARVGDAQVLRADLVALEPYHVRGRLLAGLLPVTECKLSFGQGEEWSAEWGTTDAEGGYTFTFHEAGTYRLAAQHARGSGRLVLELVPGGDVVAPDLVLQDHVPLCGVVRYRDGTPIAGLRVRAEVIARAAGDLPEVMLRLRHRPPTARTGSDGRFAFEALPCGRYRIELPVESTGARDHVEAPVAAAGEEVQIVVDRVRLCVRCVDAIGAPLPPQGLDWVGWAAAKEPVVRQVMAGALALDDDAGAPDALSGGEAADLLVARGTWWRFASLATGPNGESAPAVFVCATGGNEVPVTVRVPFGLRWR